MCRKTCLLFVVLLLTIPAVALLATAAVSFDSPAAAAMESTTSAALTVALSDPEQNQTYAVDFTVTGGTAAENLDYIPISGTLTFQPGQTTQTITLTIIDDALDEDNETIELTLSNPTGGDLALGAAAVHTYTILDPRPRVEFAAGASAVSERIRIIHRPVKVPVRLSVPAPAPMSVVYVVSATGTAARGVDYVLPNGILKFEPGQTTADISFYIVDDNIREPDETIFLRLLEPSPGSLLGATTRHTLTIIDGGQMAPPNFDLSQDGSIDFFDVAILLSSWLECTLDPPELCRQ